MRYETAKQLPGALRVSTRLPHPPQPFATAGSDRIETLSVEILAGRKWPSLKHVLALEPD